MPDDKLEWHQSPFDKSSFPKDEGIKAALRRTIWRAEYFGESKRILELLLEELERD
jgi:hypothetical protein